MPPRRRAHGWLCVAPAGAMALDAAMTLCGQPRGYWSGIAAPNEASSIGHWLLAAHPLAFAGAMAAWIGVVAVAILLLPWPLARWASAGFVIGHVGGASSWMSYASGVAVGVVAALVLAWTWGRAEHARREVAA